MSAQEVQPQGLQAFAHCLPKIGFVMTCITFHFTSNVECLLAPCLEFCQTMSDVLHGRGMCVRNAASLRKPLHLLH